MQLLGELLREMEREERRRRETEKEEGEGGRGRRRRKGEREGGERGSPEDMEGLRQCPALTLLLPAILLWLFKLSFLLHKYLLYIIYEIGSFSHLTGSCFLRLHWGNLENESFDHNLDREQ